MAGCECENWEMAISNNEVSGIINIETGEKSWGLECSAEDIKYCPWCASKLTEEAGDGS